MYKRGFRRWHMILNFDNRKSLQFVKIVIFAQVKKLSTIKSTVSCQQPATWIIQIKEFNSLRNITPSKKKANAIQPTSENCQEIDLQRSLYTQKKASKIKRFRHSVLND